MKPTLFIMVKEPHLGRVKTRLGAGIGLVRGTWWFRHQTTSLIRRLSHDTRWHTVLAVSPDAEGLQSRVWPAHIDRWAQGGGNLGDRMRRIFCSNIMGPIVIIGADIPDISQRHIANAFRALGKSDAVYGPAPDGGYWLIGLKRRKAVPKSIFQDVRWSSENALLDTQASISDMSYTLIETLQDVDTIDDMKRLRARRGQSG